MFQTNYVADATMFINEKKRNNLLLIINTITDKDQHGQLTNGEDWAKDGRVVDCGTIPTPMPELELTLAW